MHFGALSSAERQFVNPDVERQAEFVSLNTYPVAQVLQTARVEVDVAAAHVAQLENARVVQTVIKNYNKYSIFRYTL